MGVIGSLRKFRRFFHLYVATRDFNFHRRIEWNLISSWLRFGFEENICDIGCDDGFYTRKLAKRGFNAFGIDLNKKAIHLANGFSLNTKTGFLIGDAEFLPFKNESFDKIVLISVLEHINDDEKAIGEVVRVLKTGGFLVVSVDSLSHKVTSRTFKEKHAKKYLVERYYTISYFKEKIERHGMKLEKTQYILNSRVSNFFFRLHHAYIFFPISYPLSRICDRLFGSEEGGAMLISKARKL